jgi:hypothetical protein
MLAQWMELQRAQQLATDRFLRIQERLLFGASEQIVGSVSDLPVTGAEPTVSSPTTTAPIHRPAAAPAMTVRPTAVTPSRAAIHLTTSSPSGSPETRPAVSRSPLPAAAPTNGALVAAAQGRANGAAAPAAMPATNGSAAKDGPPSTEQFRQDLLQVVSDRTGYPIDMLDENLPLEAGLGIDSIKTVEVFSKLKPYHPYFQREDQDEEEMLKVFTRLKTLGDIVRNYDEQVKQLRAGAPKTAEKPALAAPLGGNGAAARSSLNRFELEPVAIPAASEEKKNLLNTT